MTIHSPQGPDDLLAIAGWRDDGFELEIDYRDDEKSIFVEGRTRLAARMHDLEVRNLFFGSRSYMLGGGILSPNTIIGRYCSISHNSSIGVGRHPMEWLSTGTLPDGIHPTHEATQPYTVIGCDVWIGVGATVVAGVKIGHGACIGAGSVVTRDIAPYTVVGGVPAKPIRPRFPEATTAALLASKWWVLPEQIIRLLPYDDIEACVSFLQNL